MKIARYYQPEGGRWAIVKGTFLLPIGFQGSIHDLVANPLDVGPLGDPVPVEDIRFAPPLSQYSKIIAIGLNYLDHVQESKGKIPEVPIVFSKFTNSLIGHGGQITWGKDITGKVDFEAELAVVIGKEVCRCEETEAADAILGYTCANDVSARDLQFGDGQWVRGKSLDTFCPLGPWLVTPDEIPDPNNLSIRCWLNGKLMQDSNTGRMIFKVPYLISFLSRHFTLFPGDLILTGTPHGVGAFRDPPVYLNDGDEIVVEIEGIGRLANTCRVR
ncbi:MAG: fumarylacetoacetate hydrolase family protein [Desulfatiglandales bacterium]